METLIDKIDVVSRFSGTKIKVINGVGSTDLPKVGNYKNVASGTFLL
jgi:hypothetical protein